MSLANECWAANNIGEDGIYTMMQHWQTMKTLHAQNPAALPETYAMAARAENLKDFAAEWSKAVAECQQQEKQYPDKSIMQWATLALAWLEKILG